MDNSRPAVEPPVTPAGRDGAPDPLVRLFERPESGLGITLSRGQGLAAWRDALSIGRLVAAAMLIPLLFLVYRGAIIGAPPTGIGWTVLLLGAATIGALALATYLPQRGAGAGTSPCAAIAGVWVLFAGMILNAPANPVNGALALAMVSLALFQRLRGAAACGSGSYRG